MRSTHGLISTAPAGIGTPWSLSMTSNDMTMPPPAESPASTIALGSIVSSRNRYAARQSCTPQGNGNCGARRYSGAKTLAFSFRACRCIWYLCSSTLPK